MARRRSSTRTIFVKRGHRTIRRVGSGFKQFFKGFLTGNGAQDFVDEIFEAAVPGAPDAMKIPVRMAAAAGGGFFGGGKMGVLGGIAATGLDLLLQFINARSQSAAGAGFRARL